MTRKEAIVAVEAIVGPFPEARKVPNKDRTKRYVVGFYSPLDRQNPDFNKLRFIPCGFGASYEEAIEMLKKRGGYESKNATGA